MNGDDELQRLLASARKVTLALPQRAAIRDGAMRKLAGAAPRWRAGSVAFGVCAAVVGALIASYAVTRPVQPSASATPSKVEPTQAPLTVAPTSAPAAESAPEAIAPTPTPEPRRHSGAAARPLAAASERVDEDALTEELALVGRASKALAANEADRALALALEHQARFPHGALLEERETVRVLALCALKRSTEATSSLQSFVRQWPHSAQRPRLEAACGLR